ncbi:MAG: hypothetical protein R3318_04235 [Gammaproteobacteria bacterium]|nr:hypothetical protein [Gammaproteobacteria bacterium]
MDGSENIRFIVTVTVIVILLSLHYFYHHRYQRIRGNSSKLTKIIGWLILLFSFGAAWWLMNR